MVSCLLFFHFSLNFLILSSCLSSCYKFFCVFLFYLLNSFILFKECSISSELHTSQGVFLCIGFLLNQPNHFTNQLNFIFTPPNLSKLKMPILKKILTLGHQLLDKQMIYLILLCTNKLPYLINPEEERLLELLFPFSSYYYNYNTHI